MEFLGQLNNYQPFKILHHGIGNITDGKGFSNLTSHLLAA
jgi:hypothetical protein